MRDAVRSGLLVTALSSTGVDEVDLSAAVATPEALGFTATPVEPGPPDLHVVPDPDADEKAVAAAQERVETAAAAVAAAEKALAAAAATVDDLEARTMQLQAEIDELRGKLAERESAYEEVDEELSEAEDARSEAGGRPAPRPPVIARRPRRRWPALSACLTSVGRTLTQHQPGLGLQAGAHVVALEPVEDALHEGPVEPADELGVLAGQGVEGAVPQQSRRRRPPAARSPARRAPRRPLAGRPAAIPATAPPRARPSLARLARSDRRADAPRPRC